MMCIVTELEYVAFSGRIYHPESNDGKWYLMGVQYSLESLIKLFDLTEEEIVFIKLKYGN